MSYAIVSVIYGLPLTKEVSDKIREWESSDDARYVDDDGDGGLCGFTEQYSAGGDDLLGFCGVKLGELESYEPIAVDQLPGGVATTRFKTTRALREEAERRIAALDPELRELLNDYPVTCYLVWSDA